MFQKLAFTKCVTLLLLTAKLFNNYEMFTWIQVFLPLIIVGIITMLLNALEEKFEKLNVFK